MLPCESSEKGLQGIRVLVESLREFIELLLQAFKLLAALRPIGKWSRRGEGRDGLRDYVGATVCSDPAKRRRCIGSEIVGVVEEVLVEATIADFRVEPPNRP
jgi:hypothetical protein